MDELINAYAYSNLQRAILTKLLADMFGKQVNAAAELQNFYNDVKEHLRVADFPAGSNKVDEVRQSSLALAQRFFRDVELVLLNSQTLTEPRLIV